ncbi:MAG TPA: hypothetical protein VFT99_18800, partial [Roseiflexaceae bacterium]|nr:hypothetical protein [Roseiflexaceae bacterium]
MTRRAWRLVLFAALLAVPTAIAFGGTAPTQTFLPLVITASANTTLGGCPVFPPDNPWNRDVSHDPVDPNSNSYIASISAG